MAAGSNKVTLTFAGDSASLDRSFKNVQDGGDKTVTSLKHAEKGMKELGEQFDTSNKHLRAGADLIDGTSGTLATFGGAAGAAAGDALNLTRGLADMAHGLGTLAPKLLEGAKGLTGLQVAGIGTGTALLALGLTMESKSAGSANIFEKGIKDVNYALATNVNFVGQAIPGLSKLTGWWKSSANAASEAAHSYGDANDQLQRLRNQQRIAGTFGIADQNPGGDAFADQSVLDMMDLDPTPVAVKSATRIRSSGSTISTAVKDAAAKVKTTLGDWQGIADKFSNVAKGIADSLGPKLVASVGNTLLLSGSSGGLLAGLNAQLKDTLHLQKDLKALAKGGLSSDLLTQLVNGGTGSIGAADELLAGGKAGISAVNKVAGKITKAGGSIAGSEAAREVKNDAKAITVHVDVKGSQKEFEAYLMKLFTTKGAKAFGLKAA